MAKLALHFNQIPTEVDPDQINDYLYLVKREHKTPSDSYFKFTVYGLRFAYRVEGMKDKRIELTWGQTMQLHPHLHCVVPAGGLSKAGKWKTARNQGKFLFPVKAMSKVFRAKYVGALKSRIPDLDKVLVNALFKKDWVVYAKRPFAHASHVIEYLGKIHA